MHLSSSARHTTPPTIVHAIMERISLWPDRPALVFEGSVTTYRQLQEQVLDGAAWLADRGIGPGHKIAVLSTNHPFAIVGALAGLYVGATWVPANPRDSAVDIGALLGRAGCDVLLHGHAVMPDLGDIRRAAPDLRIVEPLDSIVTPRHGAPPANQADPDAPAAIFFTGGTTGRPKGAVFLHRNVRNLADHYVELMLDDDEVILAAAPLTHVAGRQCLTSLSGGATTVILRRFDPTAVLDAIERHRITTTTTTPTMLYMLLDEPRVRQRDTSSLRRLTYGAAPIALPRLKEAIEVFGPVLQGGYGQTESPMLIAALPPDEHIVSGKLASDQRLQSVGKPLPVSDVRIVASDDRELAPGEVGEIVVAGDYQMHEYYRDSEATAAARRGQFIRTGDLGKIDADGYLTICGRIKDMIITGGFNVYAAEVESALASHPGVYEAAVFGLPDDLWGEAVTAAVQLREGVDVTVDELRSWVHDLIGGVKTPKRIELVDDIPRNSNGKILKRELVARYDSSAA